MVSFKGEDMRKPIIAGNWKMYKDVSESIELANGIKRVVYNVENVEIIISPTFVNLSNVCEILIESNIFVAAQNCYWENEGAFTGEISVPMIKKIGCEYVIIGHSERRKYFGETDVTVNKKVKSVIDGGLIPIMCVGETLEEREAEKTMEVVKTQIAGGLKGLSEEFLSSLIIAYEPVWAIGTGKTATREQAQEVHAKIRELIKEMYSSSLSEVTRVLYGGSVKSENIVELMEEKDIDGALIGGASLKCESFIDIIKKTSELYEKKKD